MLRSARKARLEHARQRGSNSCSASSRVHARSAARHSARRRTARTLRAMRTPSAGAISPRPMAARTPVSTCRQSSAVRTELRSMQKRSAALIETGGGNSCLASGRNRCGLRSRRFDSAFASPAVPTDRAPGGGGSGCRAAGRADCLSFPSRSARAHRARYCMFRSGCPDLRRPRESGAQWQPHLACPLFKPGAGSGSPLSRGRRVCLIGSRTRRKEIRSRCLRYFNSWPRKQVRTGRRRRIGREFRHGGTWGKQVQHMGSWFVSVKGISPLVGLGTRRWYDENRTPRE